MNIIIEDSKGNHICSFYAEIDNYYYEDDCKPLLNFKNCDIVDRYKDKSGIHYIKLKLDGQYEKKIDDEYNLRAAIAYHDARPEDFDKDYK